MITYVPRQSIPDYPGNGYLPTPVMITTNTIVNNLINTLSLYSFMVFALVARSFAGVYRLASDQFRLWVAPRSAAHDAAKRYLMYGAMALPP